MMIQEENKYVEVTGTDPVATEDGDALSGYVGTDGRKGLPLLLSRVISIVMSPLLMPFFAVMILLYGTSWGYMRSDYKLYYTLVILLSTCVVPILCIALLHSLGIIKGVLLGSRRDRVLPLLITAICYVICAWMVSGHYRSLLIARFLLAGGACITVAFIVTFYWKISIHMLAAGGTFAMLLAIQYLGLAQFVPFIILMVALCGALASARLYLGAHTPLQVAVGFTAGFIVALCVVLHEVIFSYMVSGWRFFLL